VNDAYVEMTGYSREELLGSHCSLVVDEAVLEQSAEDLEQILEEETGSATIEADLNRADGSRLPAESRFTALPTVGEEPARKVGVVRDISERRERERALEESERRYRTIAEYFPNGIVALFDDDFTYTLAAGQGFADLPSTPRTSKAGASAKRGATRPPTNSNPSSRPHSTARSGRSNSYADAEGWSAGYLSPTSAATCSRG